MIAVFGSINLDIVFSLARLPTPGATVLGEGYRLVPGGKGANQALAAKGGTTAHPDTDNQVVAFVNDDTQQVVITFKGSNHISNFETAVEDDGLQAWESIKDNAQSILAALQNNPLYSTYEVMTDGHSLGGGMAQIFALENKLSGYGQNSLPLLTTIIPKDTGGQNYGDLLKEWNAENNTFNEVNVLGDIAISFYSGKVYLNTPQTTTTIWDPELFNNVGNYHLDKARSIG